MRRIPGQRLIRCTFEMLETPPASPQLVCQSRMVTETSIVKSRHGIDHGRTDQWVSVSGLPSKDFVLVTNLGVKEIHVQFLIPN